MVWPYRPSPVGAFNPPRDQSRENRDEELGRSAYEGGNPGQDSEPPLPEILRIGTINVQTLRRRLKKLLSLLISTNIDVACVQEARISPISFPSIKNVCRAKGYYAYMGEPHVDDQG